MSGITVATRRLTTGVQETSEWFSPFDKLSGEAICQVFYRLVNPRDIMACSRVCWSWHAITQDSGFKQSLLRCWFPSSYVPRGDHSQEQIKDQLAIYNNVINGIYSFKNVSLRVYPTHCLATANGPLWGVDDQGHVLIYFASEGQIDPDPTYLTSIDGQVLSLAPTGSSFYCGLKDGAIEVFESNVYLQALVGHTDAVHALIMANGTLFSGSQDTSIVGWDLTERLPSNKFSGHQGAVRCLAALKSGNIASGSDDQTIKIWNPKTNECMRTLGEQQGLGTILCLVADTEERLFSGSSSGELSVWDLKTGERLSFFKTHSDAICHVAIENGLLFSVSKDGLMKVWNLLTLDCLQTLQIPDQAEHKIRSCAALSGKLFFARSYYIDALDLKPSLCALVADIGNRFAQGDLRRSLDRFAKLTQPVKNEIFGELGIILALNSDDLNRCEVVFYNQNADNTSQQNAHAIHNYFCHRLLKELKEHANDDRLLYAKFAELPDYSREKVFTALYFLTKDSPNFEEYSHKTHEIFKADCKHYGERAFYQMQGVCSTFEQRLQAIEKSTESLPQFQ